MDILSFTRRVKGREAEPEQVRAFPHRNSYDVGADVLPGSRRFPVSRTVRESRDKFAPGTLEQCFQTGGT